MFATLVALLPLGLAMAISTVPLSLTILVLLSPARSRIAVPFLVGYVSGIAVVVTLLTVILRVAAPARWWQGLPVVPWGEIALGLALVVYAVAGLSRRRRRVGNNAPRWVRVALSLNRRRSFILACALSLRPKALLLSVAAGLVIVSRPLDPVGDAVALTVFTVLSSSSVAATILYTLLAPSRSEAALSAMHRLLVAHGALISLTVVLATGIVLTAHGAWQL